MKEFTELLEILSVMPEEVIMSGDINFHLETDDSIVDSLRRIWDSFNLVQHVHIPTHNKSHILDMVLTSSALNINSLLVENMNLSDHYMISII